MTVLINGTTAFIFIITLLYCVGNVKQNVYKAPPISGVPYLYVVYEATQSKAAANTLLIMIFVITIVGTFSLLASVSRLVWAFARDGGLPFSETFSYVRDLLFANGAYSNLLTRGTGTSHVEDPDERTTLGGRLLLHSRPHQHRIHGCILRLHVPLHHLPIRIVFPANPLPGASQDGRRG